MTELEQSQAEIIDQLREESRFLRQKLDRKRRKIDPVVMVVPNR